MPMSGGIQRFDKSLLDRMAVADRQHARHVFFADARTDQDRAFAGVQQFAHVGGFLDAPRSRGRA